MAALDINSETFVIYVASLEAPEPAIHPLQAPILAALEQNKVLTKILPKYEDYANIFLVDLAMELPKIIGINKHVIKLINGKQPLYRPIYSVSPVELETLKAYIKTHLKMRFIWPSKSPTSALIFFDKKPNSNFCLYIDYQGPNNRTIKNRYLLSLIGKFLDRLSRAKRFIQLDLIYAYHWIKIQGSNK